MRLLIKSKSTIIIVMFLIIAMSCISCGIEEKFGLGDSDGPDSNPLLEKTVDLGTVPVKYSGTIDIEKDTTDYYCNDDDGEECTAADSTSIGSRAQKYFKVSVTPGKKYHILLNNVTAEYCSDTRFAVFSDLKGINLLDNPDYAKRTDVDMSIVEAESDVLLIQVLSYVTTDFDLSVNIMEGTKYYIQTMYNPLIICGTPKIETTLYKDNYNYIITDSGPAEENSPYEPDTLISTELPSGTYYLQINGLWNGVYSVYCGTSKFNGTLSSDIEKDPESSLPIDAYEDDNSIERAVNLTIDAVPVNRMIDTNYHTSPLTYDEDWHKIVIP